jgi:hypothetical protein
MQAGHSRQQQHASAGFAIDRLQPAIDHTSCLTDTTIPYGNGSVFGGFNESGLGMHYVHPNYMELAVHPDEELMVLFYRKSDGADSFRLEFAAKVTVEPSASERCVLIPMEDVFQVTETRILVFVVLRAGKPCMRDTTLVWP